jgi:hypothetical protein
LRRDPDAPDGVYYECCQAAKGWDTEPGHVLYLIRVKDDSMAAIGRRWVATHAPPDACYKEVTALTADGLTFGSNDDNVITNGNHVWHW